MECVSRFYSLAKVNNRLIQINVYTVKLPKGYKTHSTAISRGKEEQCLSFCSSPNLHIKKND